VGGELALDLRAGVVIAHDDAALGDGHPVGDRAGQCAPHDEAGEEGEPQRQHLARSQEPLHERPLQQPEDEGVKRGQVEERGGLVQGGLLETQLVAVVQAGHLAHQHGDRERGERLQTQAVVAGGDDAHPHGNGRRHDVRGSQQPSEHGVTPSGGRLRRLADRTDDSARTVSAARARDPGQSSSGACQTCCRLSRDRPPPQLAVSDVVTCPRVGRHDEPPRA